MAIYFPNLWFRRSFNPHSKYKGRQKWQKLYIYNKIIEYSQTSAAARNRSIGSYRSPVPGHKTKCNQKFANSKKEEKVLVYVEYDIAVA